MRKKTYLYPASTDLLPLCHLTETSWVVPSCHPSWEIHTKITVTSQSRCTQSMVPFTQRLEKTMVISPKVAKPHLESHWETLWSSREQSLSTCGRVSLRELLRFSYAPSVLSRVESGNHNRISSRLSFSGKLLGSGSDALPVMLQHFLPNPRRAVVSTSGRDVLLKGRCREVVEMRKRSSESQKYIKKESSQEVSNR